MLLSSGLIQVMNQSDFDTARRRMVSTQLKARGIADPRLLRAMGEIPRHLFVPKKLESRAYDDCAAGIGEGQTISQPYMVALMTELLELEPTDRVLEIGTGSGYQTAILAALAQEVISIERQPALAEKARLILAGLGFENVTVLVADGTKGHVEGAPYDGIIVTAGGPRVPAPLGRQLAIGGRLVCPVGARDVQELLRLVRTEEGLEQERSIRCSFVPLIGAEGWREESS